MNRLDRSRPRRRGHRCRSASSRPTSVPQHPAPLRKRLRRLRKRQNCSPRQRRPTSWTPRTRSWPRSRNEQRATAQIELTPRLAVRWTNFPGGSNVRNGVFYRDLKPEQIEAALKVARVALGEEGFARYQEVRAADDAFAKGGARPRARRS